MNYFFVFHGLFSSYSFQYVLARRPLNVKEIQESMTSRRNCFPLFSSRLHTCYDWVRPEYTHTYRVINVFTQVTFMCECVKEKERGTRGGETGWGVA